LDLDWAVLLQEQTVFAHDQYWDQTRTREASQCHAKSACAALEGSPIVLANL
jgi:hypothetical protein